jgi:hypothetical protein
MGHEKPRLVGRGFFVSGRLDYSLKYFIVSTVSTNRARRSNAILLLSKGRSYPGRLERLRFLLGEILVIDMYF